MSNTSSYAYVGEKRKVHYNPSNPQECYCDGYGLAIGVNYFAMVAFALIFGIFIVFVMMRDYDDASDRKIEEDIINDNNMAYRDTALMWDAQADQVCIAVEPSVLRVQYVYYYIPEGEEQKRLQKFMEALPLEGKPYEGKWEKKKQVGWEIAYKDMSFMVYEGGLFAVYLFGRNRGSHGVL